MADTIINGTPEWYRDRLLDRYEREMPERLRLMSVYEGTHEYPVPLRKYRDAYQRLLKLSRSPWARLITDTYVDRLHLLGFRVDGDGNTMLWDEFNQSHISTLQHSVHRDALIIGTSYASVDLYPDRHSIAYESALEVVHETAAGDPYTVVAALKLWNDTIAGEVRCVLSMPEANYRWSSPGTTDEDLVTNTGETLVRREWLPVGSTANPFGQVAVVPFVIRRNGEGYGRSDLTQYYQQLQRIESETSNLLLAMELGAFRQRWATGLEVPRDEDGNPVEPFHIALDRLWISEDPDTTFGAFPETDLRPIIQAIDQSVTQLSAISRVPTNYFGANLANPPSAEMVEISESSLIQAIKERQATLGESWEAVARLVSGRTDDSRIVSLWTDARVRSESQMLDAAVKLSTLVPIEEVWEFLGYEPEKIADLKKKKAAEDLKKMLLTPTPGSTSPLAEQNGQQPAPPPQNGQPGAPVANA